MEHTVRIATLDNEIQAQLLGQLLTGRGIPHIIRSYHDTAYDGLFQTTQGWGHVEAPEEFREKVVAVMEGIGNE
jgi:hypothetical protein